MIQEAAREEIRVLEARLEARLGELALALGRDAPVAGAPGRHAAPPRPAAGEARVWAVRLLDADGRPLWPAPWDPDVPAAAERRFDRLLFDLRREADRLRFGLADADAAVRLWRDAGARATSPRLTAVARAEADLLEARLGRVDASTVRRRPARVVRPAASARRRAVR